jgi:hypothetical protein
MKLSTRAVDWAGIRCGHVVPLRPLRTTEEKRAVVWECLCDCGKTVEKAAAVLRRGVTYCSHKCGLRPTNTTHGMCGTREYAAWVAMKSRCNNPRSRDYVGYGGRGIRVHAPWDADFSAFFAHIGSAPSTSHTLDRIDPDGSYVPGNVRWVTQAEQCVNRRNTIYVDGPDGRVTLVDLAREHEIPYARIYGRYLSGARGHDLLRPAYRDYSGLRQGKLSVVRPEGVDKHGNRLWLCTCDCGNTTHKSSKDLRTGIKSCSIQCGVPESNRARAKNAADV